jgi:DNA-3-methyladenine glycosylase II
MTSSLGTTYQQLDGNLRRVLRLNDKYFLVEFSPSLDRKKLRVTLFGKPSEDQVAEAKSIAKRIFAYDHPLRRAYRMISRVKTLAQLIPAFNGLRIIQTPSVFEMVAIAIIGQQVNLTFAAKVKQQLIREYGNRISVGSYDYFGFPSPESISRSTPERLRSIQFSQRKAEYLIDFAKAVVSGEVNELALMKLSDEAIFEELSQFRGIGRWTVDMVLMRALGRLDVLPALDVGLQKAYGRVFRCKRPTSDELLNLTSRWKGFRSYASFYLWASLTNDIAS